MGRESVGAAGDRGPQTLDDFAAAVVGLGVEKSEAPTVDIAPVKHPRDEAAPDSPAAAVTLPDLRR